MRRRDFSRRKTTTETRINARGKRFAIRARGSRVRRDAGFLITVIEIDKVRAFNTELEKMTSVGNPVCVGWDVTAVAKNNNAARFF